MKKLFPLLLLLAVLLSTSAQAQQATRSISTVPQLTDSIQRIMRREHLPGLLFVLASPDSTLCFTGGLGLADVEKNKPVTAHTLFRLGSVTKTFVAVGLLQLVEQGKINLQDEVRKLAPEIPIDNPWEATDPVRVVHVLEHTAGFDDMHLNHVYNTTPTDPTGAAAVQVFQRELRCRWRPGERMSYSNPGYEVAGYLLEKRSGQLYADYLAQHLLRPLGMADATAALRPTPNPALAKGYHYDAGRYQARLPLPIYASPAGSMSASAADMQHWLQFFLHDFRAPNGAPLLKPASLMEMETAHSALAVRAGLPFGYALANSPKNYKGKAVFRGHGGGIDGFTSSFGYNRELGVGYALSNNGGQSLGSIEKLVQSFLLQHLPAPAMLPTVPLDAAAVAPYLGHYRSAAPRNELAGFAEYLLGDQQLLRSGQFLLLQPLTGRADTLLPTGPLTFRRRSELFPSIVLTRDKDGHRALISPQGFALEAGPAWWLPAALLALSVMLIVSAVLAGLIWLILALRGQLPRAQLLPRLLPLLAITALVVTFVAFGSLTTHIWQAGHLNLKTILLFVGPLAVGVFTLAGLILTVRYFRHFRSRVVAWYLLLTYGALGWLVAVLGTYGWLGLRLWAV